MRLIADPLVEVAVRVYAEFADRSTLAEVLAVVARARNDLDTPKAVSGFAPAYVRIWAGRFRVEIPRAASVPVPGSSRSSES